MRSHYPLFQSHLDLAHQYWDFLVRPGDIVIDATCGNGKDSLKLAKLALSNNQGLLYAYDIQPQAIAKSRQYLAEHLSNEEFLRVQFRQMSHAKFEVTIIHRSVKLIVYNLGYLPGGNKHLTTETTTTLSSLQSALDLITLGGAISMTCYPGHPMGYEEEKMILKFSESLDPLIWSVCHHRWLNRCAAPSLLILQRSFKTYDGFVT